MMKKRYRILLFILFTFSILAKEKVTILADEHYEPYCYADNGKLTGIYVDIIKEISSKLKDFEIVLEPIPWIRGIKMMEANEAYAIVPPWYRPKERPFLTYSEPILKEKLVIVGLDKMKKAWPKDFFGKTIGINRGFLVFDEARKKTMVIEEANSTRDNILKLIKGRIDYYANDKYSTFAEVSALIREKKIDPIYLQRIKEVVVLKEENSYIGYSKAYNFPNRLKFEKAVNEELKKMKSSGRIDEIIKKYSGISN